jgi:hypothetical protein
MSFYVVDNLQAIYDFYHSGLIFAIVDVADRIYMNVIVNGL